jgi:hypothetical protein
VFKTPVAFFKAVASHWYGVMTGAGSLLFTLIAVEAHDALSQSELRTWLWIIAAACLFLAMLGAWHHEYMAKLTAEKKTEAAAQELANERQKRAEAEREAKQGPLATMATHLGELANKPAPGEPSELYPPGMLARIRSLTLEQKAGILRELRSAAGKISIDVQTGAEGGERFGHELRDVFVDAGWTVDQQVVPLRGFECVPGLALAVTDTGSLTADEKKVMRALHAAGLAFETIKVKFHMGHGTELRVTTKLSS